MVVIFVDGEEYGLFDYDTSLRMERELMEDFPGSSIRVWEF